MRGYAQSYTQVMHMFFEVIHSGWREEAAGGCPLNGGGKVMARKTRLQGKVDYIGWQG